MVSIPIEKDLEEAKRVLSNESNAIKQLAKSLGKNYIDAIDKLDNVKGRVIFTGIGKSGHVARKMASTFSSESKMLKLSNDDANIKVKHVFLKVPILFF